MATPARLLVCSIGNPAPYLNTLHSAGHTILSLLPAALDLPAFAGGRAGTGLSTTGAEGRIRLHQTASLMNNSGPAVAREWASFVRSTEAGAGARLVVVHDELELPLGQVRVREGSASPKGHNGLKSIQLALKGQALQWTRIGVGIGRPESRESADVARFVLRKMGGREREKIEASVPRVVEALAKLQGGSLR